MERGCLSLSTVLMIFLLGPTQIVAVTDTVKGGTQNGEKFTKDGALLSKPTASHLLESLVGNYGPTTIRPVYNASQPTRVAIRIFVTQVIELNEREQFVQVSGLMRLKWRDEFLSWNETEYPGVQRLYVSAKDIWKPDITLYTNVDEFFERTKSIPTIVTPDGYVEWNFPAILKSSCQIDTLLFPFDIQRCALVFASWVFTITDIELYKDNEQKQNLSAYFVPNGVWEMSEVKVEEANVDYPCCPDPFAQVVFYLVLCRRPLFYIISIILPAVLLAVICLAVYILPPDSGEKISLGVTTLLALILFQELIGGSLPPSSDKTPIISFFFTPMVVISCTSVLCSVVILNLHHRGSHKPVPRWLRHFTFRCLAPILCYHRGPATLYVFNNNCPTRSSTIVESWPRTSAHNIRESSSDGPVSPQSGHCSGEHTRSNGDNSHGDGETIHMNSFCDHTNGKQCCHDRCVRELVSTLEKLHAVREGSSKTGDETNERTVSEWQEVAIILNRLMLLVSVVTMFSSITLTITLFLINGLMPKE
ncbi:neuronal acetylcholine receptor subunit alpha-10-like isoform X2 [Asterias amurensis]|uniref:neuronal acetylcholine receptor subunit alpha-10-like isoform X2 n=1 Tax=Asterias amurensis TaxID=7602 RepID=UPI003AB8EACE